MPSDTAAVTAKLLDVFSVTGRGTVLVLGDIEGAILIGDQGAVDVLSFAVTGLESIRFADAQEFPPDTIGVLVDLEAWMHPC